MKNIKKTISSASKATKFGFIVLVSVVTAGTYSMYPGLQSAEAESSCATIAECNDRISENNAAVADLRSQAVSYQDAITRLQSQINIVQGQIAESKRQQADLEAQIKEAEAQLEQQRGVLFQVIRAMYIDGPVTPIEALATSNDLSEYVNKEEYRRQVQRSVEETMKKIAELQSELSTKKTQVAALLAQQQSQANQLARDRAEQQELVNYNASQQAAFNAETAANKSKLAALIAAQRRANSSSNSGYSFIRFPGAVKSFDRNAYPYKNAGFSMSTAPGCNDNDGPDRWGYCTRQCVSYTAWAVEASGRSAPLYWGSAKYWDERAVAAGVPVYSTPAPGDIAVSNSGTWGHVMYVEKVDGNQIYVSQYNQALDGRFSYQWRTWQ